MSQLPSQTSLPGADFALTLNTASDFKITRIFDQSWDAYKIFGEAALATLGKIYDYNFVSDFVKEQYDLSLGPKMNPNVRATFVLTSGDTIEGIIGGCIVGNVCQEFIWYVKPASRKSNHGVRLLRALEGWAKEKRCNYILLSRFMVPDKKTGYIKFKEILVRKLNKDV